MIDGEIAGVQLVHHLSHVVVQAYAEFENVVEVDRDRNVIFDFGV